VGRGVFEDFHLVASARDDLPAMDDDGADRHFVPLRSATGLPQGFPHKVEIAVQIDDVFHARRKCGCVGGELS
jgi:hypothetical protein